VFKSREDEIASLKSGAAVNLRTVHELQSKNDILMRYLDEQTTPNPQLVAMIKDRQRSIKYYKDRAKELTEEADEMTATEVAKSMALTEAQGRIQAAEIKATGEAGEAQAKQFEAAYGSYLDVLGKVQSGDLNDDQFRQTIMAMFGDQAAALARSEGLSETDALETLSEMALAIAGGDVNEAARMTSMIRQIYESGRLGG
jgi:hypothetical protein